MQPVMQQVPVHIEREKEYFNSFPFRAIIVKVLSLVRTALKKEGTL